MEDIQKWPSAQQGGRSRKGSNMLVEESPRQRASTQTEKAGEKLKAQLHFRKHAAPVRVVVRFQESRRDRKHPQKGPWP